MHRLNSVKASFVYLNPYVIQLSSISRLPPTPKYRDAFQRKNTQGTSSPKEEKVAYQKLEGEAASKGPSPARVRMKKAKAKGARTGQEESREASPAQP